MSQPRYTDGSNWYTDGAEGDWNLEAGIQLQIAEDAWPGSTDECHVAARGKVGTVVGWDDTEDSTLVYLKVDGVGREVAADISELGPYTA